MKNKKFTHIPIFANPEKPKPARGFTLVELMLTMAIAVIAISSSLAVYVNCMFLNESNKNLVIAVSDAQYILEEIKGLPDPYNDVATYSPSQFSNLNGETISLQRTVKASGTKDISLTLDLSLSLALSLSFRVG